MRVCDLARLIKRATLHRRHEYREATTFSGFRNKSLKICFVGRERADSLALLFLVVVPLLDKQIVTTFHSA